MSEFKVGDVVVSDVTQRATVYTITAISKRNGNQLVQVAIDGNELHGTFSADLFDRWNDPMQDTRDYLDVITSDVERTENEIS